MKCQRCNSIRITGVSAASDIILVSTQISATEIKHSRGTVPEGLRNDDVEFHQKHILNLHYCLSCGQIQGEFPKPLTKLERV